MKLFGRQDWLLIGALTMALLVVFIVAHYADARLRTRQNRVS